jgi:hypothetical protein
MSRFSNKHNKKNNKKNMLSPAPFAVLVVLMFGFRRLRGLAIDYNAAIVHDFESQYADGVCTRVPDFIHPTDEAEGSRHARFTLFAWTNTSREPIAVRWDGPGLLATPAPCHLVVQSRVHDSFAYPGHFRDVHKPPPPRWSPDDIVALGAMMMVSAQWLQIVTVIYLASVGTTFITRMRQQAMLSVAGIHPPLPPLYEDAPATPAAAVDMEMPVGINGQG